MDSFDAIRSLFTARVGRRGDSYVIEVPRSEVDLGAVSADGTYRVALLEPIEDTSDTSVDRSEAVRRRDARGAREDDRSRQEPARPVREGDVVAVTIDDTGDEGDGIARIGAGYVLFVAEAKPGDEVAVEVTAVRDTYAFGEVVGDVATDRPSPTP